MGVSRSPSYEETQGNGHTSGIDYPELDTVLLLVFLVVVAFVFVVIVPLMIAMVTGAGVFLVVAGRAIL